MIAARLMLFACVIFWGWSFVATKIALEYVTPVEVMALRYLFGLPVLILILLAKKIRPKFERRDYKGIILGSIIITVHFLIQITGINYTTATNTGWIISVTPLVMAVLAFFYPERKNWHQADRRNSYCHYRNHADGFKRRPDRLGLAWFSRRLAGAGFGSHLGVLYYCHPRYFTTGKSAVSFDCRFNSLSGCHIYLCTIQFRLVKIPGAAARASFGSDFSGRVCSRISPLVLAGGHSSYGCSAGRVFLVLRAAGHDCPGCAVSGRIFWAVCCNRRWACSCRGFCGGEKASSVELRTIRGRPFGCAQDGVRTRRWRPPTTVLVILSGQSPAKGVEG